jgi:hypothetical protein
LWFSFRVTTSTLLSPAALSDAALLEEIADLEVEVRRLDARRSLLASELARRSRRELGDSGLAIQRGYLTPEAMLRSLTRGSFADAARRIRVGALVDGPAAFLPIAAAVAAGSLGVEAADRIVRTLEPVAGLLSPENIAELALSSTDADDAGALARNLRDGIDLSGVPEREEALRGQRSLRRGPVSGGLRRVTLVLDPESDAIVMGAIDHAMSPRLGGPRFTSHADKKRAEAMLEDPRTNEQLALDTLVDLVRLGVEKDDGRIFGSSRPAVRVTIPLAALQTGAGAAWLEGSQEPVSIATARRLMCDVGALPLVLSGASQPLELGLPRRLFNNAQRVALSNRDGGCRWPGCNRPPSWCEAHHVAHHSQGGATDVSNGILLCRRHHLLLHNYFWDIEQPTPGEFLLVPPARIDPTRTPRDMPSKLPPWLAERSNA